MSEYQPFCKDKLGTSHFIIGFPGDIWDKNMRKLRGKKLAEKQKVILWCEQTILLKDVELTPTLADNANWCTNCKVGVLKFYKKFCPDILEDLLIII